MQFDLVITITSFFPNLCFMGLVSQRAKCNTVPSELQSKLTLLQSCNMIKVLCRDNWPVKMQMLNGAKVDVLFFFYKNVCNVDFI